MPFITWVITWWHDKQASMHVQVSVSDLDQKLSDHRIFDVRVELALDLEWIVVIMAKLFRNQRSLEENLGRLNEPFWALDKGPMPSFDLLLEDIFDELFIPFPSDFLWNKFEWVVFQLLVDLGSRLNWHV